MNDLNELTIRLPHESNHNGGAHYGITHTVLDDIASPLEQVYGLRLSTPNLAAKRPPRRDLVAGWLPEVGVSLSFGDSQTRKTFTNVDLAAHIASDRDFWRHNMMVRNGLVCWVGAEDYEGVERRFEAFRQHFGFPELNVLYIEQDVLLTDTGMMDSLEKMLKKASMETGRPLRLTVFDTFEACFTGHDVNAQKDVGTAFRNLHKLARNTESHVRVIDHCGHKQKERPKGCQTKEGMADCVDRVEAHGDDTWVFPTKSRHGPKPEPFGFAFRQVNYRASDGTSDQTLVVARAISGLPPKSTATGKDHQPRKGTANSAKKSTRAAAFSEFKDSGRSYSYKQLLTLAKDHSRPGSDDHYNVRQHIINHEDTVEVNGYYVHKDNLSALDDTSE